LETELNLDPDLELITDPNPDFKLQIISDPARSRSTTLISADVVGEKKYEKLKRKRGKC
jgi:hypothetical protein